MTTETEEVRAPAPAGEFEAILAERVAGVVRRENGREQPAGPKARRTRRHVLLAARRVLGERGYQHTTMAEVAAAAGVSQGTVYQYFKDRADLVLEIIHDTLRGMLVRSADDWAPSEEPGSLERILTNYAAGYADAPDIARVWEEVVHLDPRLAELRRAIGSVFEVSVAEALRRGQGAGRIPEDLDPTQTARALCAMTDRYCYLSYVFDPPAGGPPPPEATGRALARLWAGALGVDR